MRTILVPEVRFFCPETPLARLIAFCAQSKMVHVGFFHDIEGVPVFSDSNARGVGSQPMAATAPCSCRIQLPGVDPEWLARAIAVRWGTPYGWRDALSFVTHERKNFKGLICTELVANVLMDAIKSGYKVPGAAEIPKLPTARTSPDELLAALLTP
jgi:hypothetical protein